MPTLNTLARIATKPIPRMLSPKGHAIIDYCLVAAFALGAMRFWNRNKRASAAAIFCGSTQLALNLTTDYRGGDGKLISLRTHREIDLGLAAMSAVLPELMAFHDSSEKKFFAAQGAAITVVNQLTRLPERSTVAERRIRRERAA
jgi:hypothetical protein